MTGIRILLSLLILSLVAFGPGAVAADEGDKKDAPAEPAKPAKAKKPLVFVPQSRGAPEIIVGGGTRGMNRLPRVQALVTKHVGLTLESRPTLYWYLAGPVDAKAELSIVFGPRTQPLVESALTGPLEAGWQRIDLGDHGVSLEGGITYQWTVRVVPEPGSAYATTTGGAIERVSAPRALQEQLAAADPAEVPDLLASSGIWYDAIDAISRQVSAAPEDAALRRRRAELLASVGLDEIAQADLAVAGQGG